MGLDLPSLTNRAPPWWPLLGLLSWDSIFNSSHCKSFENQASVDFMYGCPIFKCVCRDLTTWVGTRIVVPVMATRVAHPIHWPILDCEVACLCIWPCGNYFTWTIYLCDEYYVWIGKTLAVTFQHISGIDWPSSWFVDKTSTWRHATIRIVSLYIISDTNILEIPFVSTKPGIICRYWFEMLILLTVDEIISSLYPGFIAKQSQCMAFAINPLYM